MSGQPKPIYDQNNTEKWGVTKIMCGIGFFHKKAHTKPPHDGLQDQVTHVGQKGNLWYNIPVNRMPYFVF